MKESEATLTIDEMRAAVYYDSDTGIFTRKQLHGRGGIKPCFRPTGTLLLNGYIEVYFNRRRFLAHRLAWFYMHGRWPINKIDHRNGIKTDNRSDNLREASDLLNAHNQHRPMLGAVRHGNWFRARIRFAGKTHVIGSYATLEQAHVAYLEEKRRLHVGIDEAVWSTIRSVKVEQTP